MFPAMIGGLALRALLWGGSKVVSGYQTTRRSIAAEGANTWGFLKLAAQPKTNEVALEMAHRTTLAQGSWFSPIRIIVTSGVLLFVWGAYGWFVRVPTLKAEASKAKEESTKACMAGDEREACQMFFALSENNEALRRANLEAEIRTQNLGRAYVERMKQLSETVQNERRRAALAAVRMKKANDNAAKIASGSSLSVDDYIGIVQQLGETEAGANSPGRSREVAGPDSVASGMLPGTSAIPGTVAKP